MKPDKYFKERMKMMWQHVANPKEGMPFVRMFFLTKEERTQKTEDYKKKSKELDHEMFGKYIARLRSN